ncbi:MAG: class I SAM-dependent rRNA methyltransferase, partial [bacterium]
MPYPDVYVKSGSAYRFRDGHPWIFSNELDGLPEEPEPGSLVSVLERDGAFIGIGTYNRHSLIAVRLLTRQPEALDESFFEQRLRQSLRFREQVCPGRQAYRLVHGEADGLPGLVIDRYGDVFAMASYTVGMDRFLPMVIEVLNRMFSVQAIVLRNDVETRKLENLQMRVDLIQGELPQPLTIQESGATFEVDVLEGQKTGWFFDQSENRAFLSEFVDGRDVLDAFCYTGAWAVSAAMAGAKSVIGVDSSVPALELAARNAERNNVSGIEFIKADVFNLLPAWGREGRTVDVIVLDPPPFARSKRHRFAAAKGYRKLH